jgi:hypothetical protein
MVGSSDTDLVGDRKTFDDSRSFRIIAAWLVGGLAILALAALGPPLWARQPSTSAHLAVPVVATGLAILYTVGWPIWTSASGGAQSIVAATTPVWMLLAAVVSGTSLPIAARTAGMLLMLILVLSAVSRVSFRRPQWKFVLWCVVLILVLGAPACLLLRGADLEPSTGGFNLHLSPLFPL